MKLSKQEGARPQEKNSALAAATREAIFNPEGGSPNQYQRAKHVKNTYEKRQQEINRREGELKPKAKVSPQASKDLDSKPSATLKSPPHHVQNPPEQKEEQDPKASLKPPPYYALQHTQVHEDGPENAFKDYVIIDGSADTSSISGTC